MNEKNRQTRDENLTQHVIDPSTGKDITGEYINQRLKELDAVADKIIESALEEVRKDQTNKVRIYRKYYWEIHNNLGMGSIGPATAAAGPLMEKKKQKLAKLLHIQFKDIL
ncbi:MAG: hypothetical protein EAX91_01485 [Candidatus Lokiarchaeota archaeon]|nr:hypothetical protein [Candidatus Lokiarchaeota archaeon]